VFRLFGFFFGRRSCRKAPGDTIAQIAQFVQAVQVGWWPVTMAISVSRGSILRRMKSSACRRRSVVVVGMRMRILMIPFAGAISLPISSSVSITTSAIGGTVAIVAVAIRIIVVVTSSPSVVIVITIVIVVVVVVVVIAAAVAVVVIPIASSVPSVARAVRRLVLEGRKLRTKVHLSALFLV